LEDDLWLPLPPLPLPPPDEDEALPLPLPDIVDAGSTGGMEVLVFRYEGCLDGSAARVLCSAGESGMLVWLVP